MFALSSVLTKVSDSPWCTFGGWPGAPLRLVSPGTYRKFEIVTWLPKSPAGRGWEGRSHGGLLSWTPHSESWSWPHARFGTPSVRLTPTLLRILAQRIFLISLPLREIR